MQVFCSILIAAAVNAHPGHGDVVQLDQSSAIEAANGKIEDLISQHMNGVGQGLRSQSIGGQPPSSNPMSFWTYPFYFMS